MTDRFEANVTVDFGRDTGQNFGTLFEARDDQGDVVAGAGFMSVYNTRFRSDRHTLQFFVRPQQYDFVLEPLPRPTMDSGVYLFDLDGKVHGASHLQDRMIRSWDDAAGAWRDEKAMTDGTGDPSDMTMRVAGKPLVVKDSRVTYDGKLILDKPAAGDHHHFYYALGHLVCFHRLEPQPSKLVAYAWNPDDNEPIDVSRALVQDLEMPGENSFGIGQHDGALVVSTNHGGVYRFDGKQWRVLRLRVPGKSFQIYSMLNWGERFWMPQYPSGRILELVGDDIIELPDTPPKPDGVSPNAREAQSSAIYGGDVYVGVWPWGELWRLDANRDKWQQLGRMFKHPDLRDDFDHPWEAEMRAYGQAHGTDERINEWGQRVTSLVPMGESLYVGTSAYRPWERRRELDFLTDEVWEDFGRVHKLTVPGCLAVPIQWSDGPTTLRFVVDNGKLSIEQDGKALATSNDAAALVDPSGATVASGRGLYGSVGGTIVKCDIG